MLRPAYPEYGNGLPGSGPRPRNGADTALPSSASLSSPPHANSDNMSGSSAVSPTYLDTDETSVDSIAAKPAVPSWPELQGHEAAFRHAGWQHRRNLIHEALLHGPVSEATRIRFDKCGSNAWLVQAADDPTRVKVRANRCRCRWCQPCMTERCRVVQANVRDACVGKDLRFLTLTLKASDDPLSTTVARLRGGFRKLRLSKQFRDWFRGGVYFLEVKLGSGSGRWHPHLHLLFEGGYIPHELIKRAWLEITGDSSIVWITRIRDSGHAAGYISKYAAKPIPSQLVHDSARLREAMEALHGVRMFNVFGNWIDLHLSDEPRSDVEWVPLMRLDEAITRALVGDRYCQRLIDSLCGGVTDRPFGLDWDDTS